jgi:hypothetical protein
MVQTLSHMYTETLGEWSRYLFLIGAVAVLYSTVFAVTAANSRLFADWYGMIGGYDRRDFGSRTKYIRIFVVLLLLFPVVTFFYMREPVVMVKVSGIAQALMLPVIGFSAVYLRYRKLPGELAPKGWITLALWGTSGVMLVVAGYSILRAGGDDVAFHPPTIGGNERRNTILPGSQAALQLGNHGEIGPVASPIHRFRLRELQLIPAGSDPHGKVLKLAGQIGFRD